VDTREELFSHILDAATHIKKGEDQLRWTTRNLHTNCEVRWSRWDFRAFIANFKKFNVSL
jgi:hypothetical protein